ncbi:hypothetical protein SPRG_10172 [Saprolegnia parasitica CBS 223.65]|uniref:Uncharacterized protein n=1 Tax=Saprolegnia parasitica (strain CBS 223.65) TaxID=695850 RepID=A0A067C1J6_SAPPC|nr:hypothetical protein SPRG_10172 [Saprolegnia parasitica CBS 223.65]KDO24639.1 hypothetical protein SPRG_10172 [Saprolegnia parasitica CBS 223.65]|eukprot:XP_012204707.1 hypothetical protein SPRG_10172 [Saprolegnia parasitica CBS 223.65]
MTDVDVWKQRCLAACDDLEEEYQQALHEVQYRAAKTKAETPLVPSKELPTMLEWSHVADRIDAVVLDDEKQHRSAQAQETMSQLQALCSTFQCKLDRVADDLYTEYRRNCQCVWQSPYQGIQALELYTRDQAVLQHCPVAAREQGWGDHERFHVNHALESAKKRIQAEHATYEERLRAQVDIEMHKPLDEPRLWETRRDMLVSRQRVALEVAHRQQKVTLRNLTRQHLRHLVEIDCHDMVCQYTALVTDQHEAGMRALRQWVKALLYVQKW